MFFVIFLSFPHFLFRVRQRLQLLMCRSPAAKRIQTQQPALPTLFNCSNFKWNAFRLATSNVADVYVAPRNWLLPMKKSSILSQNSFSACPSAEVVILLTMHVLTYGVVWRDSLSAACSR